jgi:hypothetical protein
MRERGASCQVIRVLSGYSLPLTFTQNGRPSGPACCFVFSGTGSVLGYPRGAHPRIPGPAVHRYNRCTALHYAADCGNRRIVRLLAAFNADVNAQDFIGRAVSACGESAVECGGRVRAAVCRAGARRCTLPRPMAIPTTSRSCCCAAPTGPSRTTAGNAALRRTAEPKTAAAARVQDDAEEIRGKPAEARGVRGGRDPGALRPPAHSPRPLRAPSLPTLLVTTDVPSVLAVGVRRSSGQGGNHSRSTRTITVALAARLVVHYCTRGSECRAHRARAAASIGSAKRARARRAVPRTARRDSTALHANARAARRSASSPFRPLSRRIGFGVAGRAATPGV